MIRGSLTEPRRKPNHDDARWGFFLSVNVARENSSECSAAIDDRSLWPLRLGDGRAKYLTPNEILEVLNFNDSDLSSLSDEDDNYRMDDNLRDGNVDDD
ncbi:hypothetical protein AVEN_58576-1 [Araneus ventricosus]|uniref:Uncharacterized protein n=1 Tax=Araneus ventricosus TaxID=182803 RepID=A0A4Y2GXM6_ARAVE|nr:hypothetical protein AVEN_58576-1 [Araneus ventricosus]